ncbi:MAG: (Fe-S)-binding protein [Polyangiaceae bacterium]
MTTFLPLAGQQEKALENCAYCPKLCRAVCPVSEADRRETLTPWGKMSLTWMVSRGQVQADAETAAVAWACTGCLSCRDHCDHENPVAVTLAAARADYFARGLAPAAAQRSAERFAANAVRVKNAVRSLAPGASVDPESRIGLVVGCSYLLKAPEVAAAAVRVAAALLGPVRVVDACCGLPLLQAGDREGLGRARAAFEEATRGTSRLVAVDAGCAHFLQASHAEPLVALVEQRLERLRPGVELQHDGPVRYHDPCHLGRGLGLYEEPRRILKHLLGREPEEFPRSRRDAVCSGGGGLVPETAPATSEGMARRRLEEHREAGGGLVVTACGESLARFGASGAQVMDLMTLVDRALDATP